MEAFDTFREFAEQLTLPDIAIFMTGLVLFVIWLVRTSLGKKALAHTPPRLNNMPAWLPVVPLFIWMVALRFGNLIIEHFAGDSEPWQKALLDNIILTVAAVATMAVIIHFVRRSFTEGLKGFGLNPRTIPRDLFAAVLNLIAVAPFWTLAIVLTLFFGRLIAGAEFDVQKHQQLQQITAHSQLSLRIMIVLLAVVVAPIFEEMLFRGLFQTMLRTYLLSSWAAIALVSGLFAAIHPDITHWPALFIVAACMGYAYEKSGSLFRPIVIHIIFNALGIISTLKAT